MAQCPLPAAPYLACHSISRINWTCSSIDSSSWNPGRQIRFFVSDLHPDHCLLISAITFSPRLDCQPRRQMNVSTNCVRLLQPKKQKRPNSNALLQNMQRIITTKYIPSTRRRWMKRKRQRSRQRAKQRISKKAKIVTANTQSLVPS